MTNAALRGKPDAGNPHVRFDEGEVASAATPRRGSLLYKRLLTAFAAMFAVLCARAETKTIGAYTWTYRVVNGAAEIFNNDGYGGTTAVSPSPSGKVAIPDTLGAWTVRSIGNNALRNCDSMTEVYIPECVTNIAPFAFTTAIISNRRTCAARAKE